MQTVKERAKKYLKTKWLSEFKLNNLVKSSSGGRRMRDLRLEGVKVKARKKKHKIGNTTIHYLEFKI